jgi:hypothetical protein
VAKIGREPDLDNPTTYNDKVNWLKLNDQMPEQATCCNKLAARDYVMDKCGPGLLLPIHGVAECFEGLRPKWPAVVKCNHDSGSVVTVHRPAQWDSACVKISKGLSRKFGLRGGEWGYWGIKPLCFVEEYFPGGAVDYKFHCCEGRVRWVQIISERHAGHPVEHITDENGELLGRHLDHQFTKGVLQPAIPPTWERMRAAAKKLSKDFRYVRVDLYTHCNDIRFGELTFWPKSGCYKTKDEPWFGAALDFDTKRKREPIVL